MKEIQSPRVTELKNKCLSNYLGWKHGHVLPNDELPYNQVDP